MSGFQFTKQYGSVFYIYDYNRSFYKRIAEKDNNRQDEYIFVAYFIKLYKILKTKKGR